MRDFLKTMMEEKGKKGKMGEKDVMAKLDVLKELSELMTKKAGHDIAGGMQKITVMSKDKEGLMKGLDKAEELLKSMPESEMKKEMEGKEEMEESEEEMPESEMKDSDKEEMLKKLKMHMKGY